MTQSLYLSQTLSQTGLNELNDRDQQLTEQVANRLANHKLPSLKELEISVNQGLLTLSGHVRSFHEKQIAICLSRKIDGIFGINDQIEVLN